MSTDKPIIAITGPTGAGKSTVSQALAKKLDQSVNIDADTVKHMIVSGFIYQHGADGLTQWKLLGKNIGLLARNFQHEGYTVIINGYVDEVSWGEIEKIVEINYRFLLSPNLDTNIKRNTFRPYEDRMEEDDIRRHHKDFVENSLYQSFTIIDSSQQTVNETVEVIKGLIQ